LPYHRISRISILNKSISVSLIDKEYCQEEYMKRKKILFNLIMMLLPILVFAQASFMAKDHPSDNGTAIDLFWKLGIFEIENNKLLLPPGAPLIKSVVIEKQDTLGVWNKLDGVVINEVSLYNGNYIDSDYITPDKIVNYRIIVTGESDLGNTFEQIYSAQAVATAQWFNHRKLPLLLLILMLSIAVIYYILSARSGKELFIRKINGLESMDEAVGRATEKGKPILFVPGIGDLDDIQTIAGLTILSQLAYKAATYDAELIVPVCRSMVLSTAREVVKEAYLKAGRPDAFRKDNIFYLTDDQFGYVAGIDGIMVREQPAANFFLGTFYAESLILAETGFATGAMQTAGTAQPSQLPFFVVTCDYTLIGEELFAASAYLSKEPNQLGSLKGQDFGKLIIVLMIIIGSILEMAGYHWFKNMLMME